MTFRTGPVLAALAILAAAPASGAEALKLRPIATLYADEAGAPLRTPQGVGCGGGATLVVADSGSGRVLTFGVSGTLAQVRRTVAVRELPYPIRADLDSKGDLVVLDGKSRRLGRVRADGQFGGWIDVPPAGGSGTVAVRSFALDPSGRLFVLDLAGRRIAVLGPGGALERSIAFAADTRFPEDLAVDGKGTVYVVDGVRRLVYAARPGENELSPFSKSLAEDLDFPGAIASDGRGYLFVADQNGGGIVILGPDGSFRGRQSAYGWRDGYLRYPAGVCVTDGGTVIVADRENQRVQIFSAGE